MAGTPRNESDGWIPLERVHEDELAEARLQLHWAAQIVAAVGKTFITPRDDDSHPNFEYVTEGCLRGNPTETQPVFRAALVIESPTIRLEDEHGTEITSIPLTGKTMEEVFRWLSTAIGDHSGGRVAQDLDRTLYDLPDHAIGRGGPFGGPAPDDFRQLRVWYHDADHALRAFLEDVDGASAVRCWPHHFDLGALVLLEPGEPAETARSVGLGMTPGDDSYVAPYWYVNPYPRPGSTIRPQLPGPARWHDSTWFGAVLTGSDLTALPAADQESTVRRYLSAAFAAAREMLDV